MKEPAMLRQGFANVQLLLLAVSVKILFVLQKDHVSMKELVILLLDSALVERDLEVHNVKEL
jgi:hypothetical protein